MNMAVVISLSHSTNELLGGSQVLQTHANSPLEWITLIRRGLPAVALDALINAVRVSQGELAVALDIPLRTLARHKREGRFTSEESAKLVRLARVVERAEEVFEEFEAALHWLKSPNAAMEGVTPLSMLDTDIGAENVLDTIGRIEHGVFA